MPEYGMIGDVGNTFAPSVCCGGFDCEEETKV